MNHRAIRDQIDKILISHIFAGKNQLKKLLEFLFLNIESQNTLKPDRVIRELWGNQSATKTSTDLATEISRLRRALQTYYEQEGATDDIMIGLPNRGTSASNGPSRWITAEYRMTEQNPTLIQDKFESDALPLSTSRTPRISSVKRLSLVAALVFVLALSVIAIGLRLNPLRGNRPQMARLDASTLVIMNGDGKELWSKTFPDGFWRDYYDQGLASRMWFGDLDGNGNTEVLLLYHPSANPLSQTTTLICYSDRGDERWRWKPGTDLAEIGGTPPTFRTVALAVIQHQRREPLRIVTSSYHIPYYPNQIAVIDAKGKTLREYWHSGHLDHIALADLDGDGREEIIATGISNGYHQATLIVLDPDTLAGTSLEALRPEIQLHNGVAGQERLRLLFARSDLNTALHVYNEGQEVTVEQNRVRFSVMECTSQQYCFVWYEFDKHFRLLSVTASDQFRGAHAAFYLKTKAEHLFSKAEESEFERIRCLSGCASESISKLTR